MGGGGGGWAREGGERGALKPGERADGQAARLTLTSRHPLEQPGSLGTRKTKRRLSTILLSLFVSASGQGRTEKTPTICTNRQRNRMTVFTQST